MCVNLSGKGEISDLTYSLAQCELDGPSSWHKAFLVVGEAFRATAPAAHHQEVATWHGAGRNPEDLHILTGTSMAQLGWMASLVSQTRTSVAQQSWMAYLVCGWPSLAGWPA